VNPARTWASMAVRSKWRGFSVGGTKGVLVFSRGGEWTWGHGPHPYLRLHGDAIQREGV
jgi:hypothetical protein